MRLRFGDCVLDTDRRELARAGNAIALSPKAFRLLEVLAERRPRAVPKAELRELLWPDLRAGGTTLARIVNELRKALGDPARSAGVIRTVPRFGYAFCAAATDEAPADAGRSGLSLQWGLQRVPLVAGENVIGRAGDARIWLMSPNVSRRHARILVAEGRAMLEDLGSTHGTYLGDRRIQVAVELKHGDRIGVGPAELVFSVSAVEEISRKTSV
jgi:DNA-binding winged helix-turn-helix (wHTH) protein